MCYISTGMCDCFGALLVSLMVLQLALVDQNPFQPCFSNVSFLQGSHFSPDFHALYSRALLVFCIALEAHACRPKLILALFFPLSQPQLHRWKAGLLQLHSQSKKNQLKIHAEEKVC